MLKNVFSSEVEWHGNDLKDEYTTGSPKAENFGYNPVRWLLNSFESSDLVTVSWRLSGQ
jgi:hypothetical protein